MMGFANQGVEISTRDMEDVDLYMQTLGVPARRNVDDETIKHGEQMFYQQNAIYAIPLLYIPAHEAAYY